jgi:hypothetical protein
MSIWEDHRPEIGECPSISWSYLVPRAQGATRGPDGNSTGFSRVDTSRVQATQYARYGRSRWCMLGEAAGPCRVFSDCTVPGRRRPPTRLSHGVVPGAVGRRSAARRPILTETLRFLNRGAAKERREL